MATKITVNGVAYDGVEAMPADVRREYEQLLAQFPDLADRDGDGIPEIAESQLGPLELTTTIRKKIVVNGTAYENEAAMPADVRRVFEEAMRAAEAGGANVKKHEFRISGPSFTFTTGLGAASRAPNPETGGLSAAEPAPRIATSTPIEPVPAEGRFQVALVLGALVAIGLALWFFFGSR